MKAFIKDLGINLAKAAVITVTAVGTVAILATAKDNN